MSLCASSSPEPKGGARARASVVLFDVDGTLANSTQLCFDATNAVLQKHGHAAITEAEYKYGTRYTTPCRMAWHATGGLSATGEPCGDTSAAVGQLLGAEFDAFYVNLVDKHNAAFFPGMLQLCKDLDSSNARVGALSNACGAYVRAVLAANEVSDLFRVQLGADEVPAPKPAADGLLQSCEELSRESGTAVRAEECVYIGDAPSDGGAARAAGMASIGVTWGAHDLHALEDPPFDEVVDTVPELEQAIRRCLAPERVAAP